MTLVDYKLHNNHILKSSDCCVEPVTQWIPTELDKDILNRMSPAFISAPGSELKTIENDMVQQVPSGPTLPNTSSDSRALIENQVIVQIPIDRQSQLRQEMLSMINEAIGESDRKTTDKRQTIFNLGAKEALFTARNDINDGRCLYELYKIYEAKYSLFSQILNGELDAEELDYPQTKNRGTSSTFSNLSHVIKEKLTNEEVAEFKIENLQPLR